MAKHHSYHKIGQNKNQPRVWLQNQTLSDCGFDKGTRYSRMVDMATGAIVLMISARGEKVVSGVKKRGRDEYTPVIDLCFASMVDVLGEGGDRVRVDYQYGQITISLHHHCRKVQERVARLRGHLEQGFLTEGTLCAGIGMATLALKEGFASRGITMRTEWIIDRERKYLEVAGANNPAIDHDTQIIEATLEEMEPHLLCPVDVLQFSLPCTGSSLSGRSKNGTTYAEEHPDATAVYGLLKSLEPANASVLISENVKQAQNSTTYILITGILEKLGYDVIEMTLDNNQSGAMEARERYWFVAVDKNLANQELLHYLPIYPRQHKKLGELLDDASATDKRWADNQYLKDKQVRDAAAGKGFAVRNLVTGESTSVKTIGRHYNKRRSTEPMLTREDGKERLLTPAEHARVKLADPDLVKDIPATTAHEGLGQGIDMGQGRGIAVAIAEAILKPLLERQSGQTVALQSWKEPSIEPSLEEPESAGQDRQKIERGLNLELSL